MKKQQKIAKKIQDLADKLVFEQNRKNQSWWTTKISDSTIGGDLWEQQKSQAYDYNQQAAAKLEEERLKSIYAQMEALRQKSYDLPVMCPQCLNNPGKGKNRCPICVGTGVAPIPASEVRHKVYAYEEV